jgi:hypothetical protein
MREAYRLQKNDLEELLPGGSVNLVVFFMFTGKQIEGYEKVADATRSILNSLITIVAARQKVKP